MSQPPLSGKKSLRFYSAERRLWNRLTAIGLGSASHVGLSFQFRVGAKLNFWRSSLSLSGFSSRFWERKRALLHSRFQTLQTILADASLPVLHVVLKLVADLFQTLYLAVCQCLLIPARCSAMSTLQMTWFPSEYLIALGTYIRCSLLWSNAIWN